MLEDEVFKYYREKNVFLLIIDLYKSKIIKI